MMAYSDATDARLHIEIYPLAVYVARYLRLSRIGNYLINLHNVVTIACSLHFLSSVAVALLFKLLGYP